MIIKDPNSIISTIKSLFDCKEAYHLDMYLAGRSTSKSDPGRPSVPNTFGTILLNLAAAGEYVTTDMFLAAVLEIGDRTLSRNRHNAVAVLLERGDFILRRVKGGGASEVLFPSEELIQRMHAGVTRRIEKETEWGSMRSRERDQRKKRSATKRRSMTAQQQGLQAIADNLGYSL